MSDDGDSLEVGCTTSLGTPPVEATERGAGTVEATVEGAVVSTSALDEAVG